jgi:integrase
MPKSGTGRIYQQPGSDVWWLDYSFRGKRYRESSKSKKRADAVALLKKRMGEQARGVVSGPAVERVKWEDLAQGIRDDYAVNERKSTHALNAALKHLTGHFGTMRAIDITTDRIRRYIALRQTDGAANATIQGELAALKRAFNLAVQSEVLPTRPHVPSVKVSNARKGFLEGANLERVISELPAEVQSVVRFAALTGWRKGEVLPLTWAQVDWEAGVVRLEPGTTKNDEGREFPFRVLAPLTEVLEAQREYTRQVEREQGKIIPYVFHRRGRPIVSFRYTWNDACVRAGSPGALFHDLRRSAVRNLEKAGVPRSVAMKLTGHKTEAVYRRYAIADRVALSEGVEKLAKLHGAPSEPSRLLRSSR